MEYRRIKFRNGLRLILVPQPTSFTTTVLILVEAGSEYETKRINGISHFLEHLVFKGTKNRPQPGMISTELDSLGAEYNAFTGQEYTGYWAKVQNSKVMKILEIVSDLYLNPIFNPEEIDRERGVVIEEINLYEDTPTRRIHDIFSSLLYGDQPAGWDIAGEKKVIRRLKKGDFLKYREANYVAGATLVVVAGNFNVKKVQARVQEMFTDMRRGRKIGKAKTREHQTKPAIRLKFKESDQSHLVLGVRTFDIFDRRRYALQVLSDVLGGGMSSRLFRKIREELGAAYYVRAGADLFLDHGYFAVSAGVDHAKIHQVLKIIVEEFNRLKKEFVPPDELQKAKEHLVGGLLLSLETSDELASFYGGEEILMRSLVPPKELIRKLRMVKAREIQALSKAIFRGQKLNLAVIGPHKKELSFKGVLRL